MIKDLQHNLLDLPTIKALKRLQAVILSESSIKQSYPNLLKDLGTLGQDYTIKLKLHMHCTQLVEYSFHYVRK